MAANLHAEDLRRARARRRGTIGRSHAPSLTALSNRYLRLDHDGTKLCGRTRRSVGAGGEPPFGYRNSSRGQQRFTGVFLEVHAGHLP